MAKLGRVLCVDDEPNILRSLHWLLGRKFEVKTAESGQDALPFLKNNDFDVIISDQRMPGMTGAEFLREARKISPRSMRLLLTGYSDMSAILRSVNESEIYRFIKKPWDMKSLLTVTEEACRIAQSEPVPEEKGKLDATIAKARQDAILVLDDDKNLIAELKTAVPQSVRVLHTQNLAEAVALLSEQQIGVIISNTHIANMDVTSLIKVIKQNIPDLVCVVISDKTDADMVIDLINEGQVYRFIPKPLKPGFIKLVLRSALGKRHQLSKDPGFAKRHSVEVMSADKVQQLQDRIKRMIEKAEDNGSATEYPGPSFMQSVAVGFKRLFG